MIDNQDQVERLLLRLTEALPLPAIVPPSLMASLRGRSPSAKLSRDCEITKIFYSGDEGGVLCHVTFDDEQEKEVFLVSITHLAFDRRLPIAREIAAYQKHRIKRIRRNTATDGLDPYH